MERTEGRAIVFDDGTCALRRLTDPLVAPELQRAIRALRLRTCGSTTAKTAVGTQSHVRKATRLRARDAHDFDDDLARLRTVEFQQKDALPPAEHERPVGNRKVLAHRDE